ncbi:MAG: AraC family transcriptional regulator [Lachnospiraceae bacterium]|nr:AraC family transcriptional regulator [Lachnospiraceae bacterium]
MILKGNLMDNYSHEIINDDTRLQLFFLPVTVDSSYSPLHWHGHLEIVLMRKGYMTAYVNEQKYTLKKDDMLVVNPKELHSTKTWGSAGYLLLQIPYDYLSRVLNHVSLIQFQEFFPSITMNATQHRLLDCLLELSDTYEKKEDGYLLHFSSVVYEFLYILYRNHSHRISRQAREKANYNFERIEEVLHYVKSNYKKDISLNEAAGLLNVSPEYFCRLFKKHTGQTFLEYLNAVRLLHFYQDLLDTDYSINDLMTRNGITNYKVFMRTFKDTYGITPGRMRAQMNKAD